MATNTIQEKLCTVCKKQKPISEFYLQTTTRFYAHCKSCHAAMQKPNYLPPRKAARKYCPLLYAKCSKCHFTKPRKEFAAHPTKKGGISNWCNTCKSFYDFGRYVRVGAEKRVVTGQYRRTEQSKRSARNCYFKKKFGITLADYESMVEKQGGRCAICQKPFEQLAVDHDHKTGEIRGLLCGNCNLGLGNFQDSTEILSNAITYLNLSS